MRTMLAAVLVLAAPAIAADFRGSELGGPCAQIEQRESALGSKHVPWSWTHPNLHTFKGQAFDRDVYIVYFCKSGVLLTGSYRFAKRKYDDAAADFVVAYSYIVSTYGSPSYVYANPDDSPADPTFPSVGASKPDEYHAIWITDNVYVDVDLMLDGDRAGANWRGAVAFLLARQ